MSQLAIERSRLVHLVQATGNKSPIDWRYTLLVGIAALLLGLLAMFNVGNLFGGWRKRGEAVDDVPGFARRWGIVGTIFGIAITVGAVAEAFGWKGS